MKPEMRLRVEVEPLSEARVAKVRQQVLATIDAESRARTTRAMERPRRINVAAVVSFVAAAVIAGLVTRAWIARTAPSDARLVTTESATQLTVGESSLDVAPRSMVAVHGDDARGIDVVLDRGEVTCEVAPRRGRPPFVVDAGEVRVRVVGTRFTVARDGASARVHVDHGAVEVTSRGAVTMLHDGESWPVVAPPPAPAIAPPVIEAPAPAPSVAAPRASASSRARPRHASAAPGDAPPVTELPSDFDAPIASGPPAPSAPSVREQFEAAARLEATQPARAAQTYRAIAAAGGPWAPNALYALARLDADRGQTAEAKGLLRDYLARYPHGQNAQDARELLDRLP